MKKERFLEQLRAAGVDTDQAIARFMGNETLFLKFIRRLPEALRFREIRGALEAQDGETFYLLVHNLKGTAANLSANELADCAQAILVEYHATGLLHEHKLSSLVREAELVSEKLSEILRDDQENAAPADR